MKPSQLLLLSLAVCFLLTPRQAHACAGCRNPNIPVARLNSFTSVAGDVRATVSLTGTTVKTVHRAGCTDINDCGEVPTQPEFRHNQDLYPSELRTMIEVGLTRAIGAEMHIPLRLVRTTIRYTDPTGQPYVPLDADVHHRNETLYGVGDPWLLGRIGGTLRGWWLLARGGLSVTLGGIQPDPFALGERDLRHQHI